MWKYAEYEGADNIKALAYLCQQNTKKEYDKEKNLSRTETQEASEQEWIQIQQWIAGNRLAKEEDGRGETQPAYQVYQSEPEPIRAKPR